MFFVVFSSPENALSMDVFLSRYEIIGESWTIGEILGELIHSEPKRRSGGVVSPLLRVSPSAAYSSRTPMVMPLAELLYCNNFHCTDVRKLHFMVDHPSSHIP